MRKIPFMIATCAVVCHWSLAQAAQVEDLYEIRLPVVDQSEAQRELAVRQAMRAILLKLVGIRQELDAERLRGFYDRAKSYVLRYRYETRQLDASVLGGADAGAVPAAAVTEWVVRF